MQSLLRRLGRFRSSGFVAAGVAASMVLGVCAFVVGDSATAVAVRTLTGSAWLASDRGVTLVDGLSGKATAEVALAGGGALSVSQSGSTVLVFDPTTGVMTRIDAATLSPTSAASAVDGSGSAYVLEAHGMAYVVDPAGTVQLFDPVEVRPLGEPIQLAGAITSPVVDADGTLWALVPSIGVITPIGPTGPGTDITVPAGASTLTLVSGRPVLVIEGVGPAATVARVTRTGLEPPVALRDATSSVSAGQLVASARVDGAVISILDVAAGEVLLVDMTGLGVQRVDVGTLDAGHDFGSPTRLGDFVYVADFTTGLVTSVNVATGAFGQQIAVRQGGGHFDVVTKDGLLFLNDPESGTAVVVDGEGTSTVVDKYLEEVAADVTPSATPTPTPTGPVLPSVAVTQPPSPEPTSQPAPPPTTSLPTQPTPTPTPPVLGHLGGWISVEWTFDQPEGYYNIDQKVRIDNLAPSTQWVTAWNWAGGSAGGFFGLQTDGHRLDGSTGPQAIFSIAGAVAADPACGSIPGYMTCRVPVDLEVGTWYQLRIWTVATNDVGVWWNAYLDPDDGPSVYVGSIAVPPGTPWLGSSSSLVQYFGPATNCAAVPESTAQWARPQANSAGDDLGWYGVQSRYSSESMGECALGTVRQIDYGFAPGAKVRLGGSG